MYYEHAWPLGPRSALGARAQVRTPPAPTGPQDQTRALGQGELESPGHLQRLWAAKPVWHPRTGRGRGQETQGPAPTWDPLRAGVLILSQTAQAKPKRSRRQLPRAGDGSAEAAAQMGQAPEVGQQQEGADPRIPHRHLCCLEAQEQVLSCLWAPLGHTEAGAARLTLLGLEAPLFIPYINEAAHTPQGTPEAIGVKEGVQLLHSSWRDGQGVPGWRTQTQSRKPDPASAASVGKDPCWQRATSSHF